MVAKLYLISKLETANRKPSQVDLESKPSRLKPTWANATFCPL